METSYSIGNGCFWREAGDGSSWREAVITQSSNVSYVHQETRSRRSIGLHMSQFVSEICENRWRCARLSGTSVLPPTADIVTARRHVSKVPIATFPLPTQPYLSQFSATSELR
jgi:hypothetical protein